MEWGPDAIETLRALWAEGLSTAEIGRRMGVSKNAVVGKAHRLNLPPRPSPIRRDGPATPRPASPTTLRVLVVDDDEDLAHLLAKVLVTRNYEVRTARDSLSAIRAATA